MPSKRHPMIPPTHDRATGVVDYRRHSDARVPNRLYLPDDPWNEQGEPRTWAHHVKNDRCPDGRHVVDVLTAEIERDDADTGQITITFRTSLTCTRCGHTDEWNGTRNVVASRLHRVIPDPILTRSLVAQHVQGEAGYDTWAVYELGPDLARGTTSPIGTIGWAYGARGRLYYTGTVGTGDSALRAEGTDPLAVLRKLDRATRPDNDPR